MAVLLSFIGYYKVLDFLLVASADIVGIPVVKGMDAEMLVIVVELRDEVGILYHQQEFCWYGFQQLAEPYLVMLGEILALIVGKIGIVGRIKEHKIPFRELCLSQHILEIAAAYLSTAEHFSSIGAEHIVNFSPEVLGVVGYSAIGDIELVL